jgi:hypothetical protein
MTYTQTNILDLIAEGERLKQEGLDRAVDHADRDIPDWKVRCWSLFLEWLDSKPVGWRFKVEDFRLHVEAQGKIEAPPSKRAYGFISVKGVRAGLIVNKGTVKVNNPNAHRANAGLWEKI